MGDTVSWLAAHMVWVTKYCKHVLKGDIQRRCRDLVKQICDAEDIRIIKGVISKDHVHIHIEYRPSQNISAIVKRLKGRTFRKHQEECPELSKPYWGRYFWAFGYGCLEYRNITDKMVLDYPEHHRNPSNQDGDDTIVLE